MTAKGKPKLKAKFTPGATFFRPFGASNASPSKVGMNDAPYVLPNAIPAVQSPKS